VVRTFAPGDLLNHHASPATFWCARNGDAKSGLHFCFVAPTRASVDAFHAGAIGAGGTSNGKPGLRESYGPNYYAAFVVDPDGYRIEAYCKRAS
jgi:catechol 2,3-dioxygenase-like lactoylglutathione lyase family enzyme